MAPKQLGVELGGPRRDDPRREPSNPPTVEESTETLSQAAQVAEFRSAKFSVSMPSAVVIALITAVSGFAVAWANKPAAVALTPEQSRKLDLCAESLPLITQKVGAIESRVNWIEPQIGVLLVRTEARNQQPPAPPLPTGWPRNLNGP